MKKIISILFLSIYLLGATQFSQLFNLKNLVEHYQEHKQENKSISFLDFLEMHYMHGNPKDADYEKDMKLPFKSEVPTAYSIAICEKNTIEIPEYCSKNYFTKQVFSLYKSRVESLNQLDTIWQPPKLYFLV